MTTATTPRHPWEDLLAQLTGAMSTTRAPIRHGWGTQEDAAHTSADRVVWIPAGIDVVVRPFQLPDSVTPNDQAADFLVSIYGGTPTRVYQLHADLVGWIDEIVGPDTGCAPTEDATPAVLRGGDLAALSFPFAGLAGLTLDFGAPAEQISIKFPAGTLASPAAIVAVINGARGVVRSRLTKDASGHAYLELVYPSDPLLDSPAKIMLRTSTSSSACGVLGFVVDVNDSARGTSPSRPYRPGYGIKASQPGPRGGDLATSGWGVVVPVRLYQPIHSKKWLAGVIASTPFTTGTADADGGNAETAVATP